MTAGLSSPVAHEKSAQKSYTWQEVAQHSSERSAWIIIGKKVYDVTEWMHTHPGGKDVLLLSAGRDCTDLFSSYHPFSKIVPAVMSKFEIGDAATFEFPQHPVDTGFYRELRERVGAYFVATGKHPKDPMPGYVRLFFFLLTAAVSFYVSYSSSYNWLVRILAAQLFGVCQALPLLHCMVQ